MCVCVCVDSSSEDRGHIQQLSLRAGIPPGSPTLRSPRGATVVTSEPPASQGDGTAFFFFFLGPHLLHMEVPRLGVESELRLPAYTTAIATWDPSGICDPHHSSWQCQILNLPSGFQDQTRILTDTGQIRYC